LRTFYRLLPCLNVRVTNQLNWKSVFSSCIICICQERQNLSKLLGRNTSSTKWLFWHFFCYNILLFSSWQFEWQNFVYTWIVQIRGKFTFSFICTKLLLWRPVAYEWSANVMYDWQCTFHSMKISTLSLYFSSDIDHHYCGR